MKDETTITDILVNNFSRDKSLNELADDYEALELELAREKSTHGEDTKRMTALRILSSFQLKRVLEKLVEEPGKPALRDRSHLKVIK
jgi:hypothetical protein